MLLLRKCRIAAKLPDRAVFQAKFLDSPRLRKLAAFACFVF
jgi:hypothetical protein